eukprot:GHVQ01021576.1.p1 GENE.GHVQ01021576.1~~GHVQ01021576.1.p1  ORF type:complete len:437 (+),score=83.49 GHVQ01021576.1:34-1344(+)
MFFSGGFPFDEHMFSGGGPPGRGGGGGKSRDVDTTKYYELLEIPKDSATADIKKAYRKLAIKHHPDKGGDEALFKEISRAYEVLSDPEKRELYDKYGEEGLDGSSQSDPTDIFDLFFGGGGPRRSKSGKKKGEDVVSHLKVQLDQIYNGATRKLAINKDVLCPECRGVGGPQDAMQSCDACNGQGVRVQIRQMGPMIQQTQSVCPSCRGQGKMMPASKKCKKCTGGGTVKERKLLEVFIDKGVPPNHKVVFSGEADEKPGETPGDVVFVIQQQDHPMYKRRGDDLFMKKTLSLYEALTGFKFTLKHLDSRELLIQNTPGQITKPGDVLAVKDEGMPRHKNPFIKGHLFIAFDIKFPADQTFDAKAIKHLSAVLPVPEQLNINENDPHLEHHFTQFIDPNASSQHGAGGSNREAYHDDEEGDGEGGAGGPKVQCRQQ